MREKDKLKNEHIDFSRSDENVYLIEKDLKQLYQEEFSEALGTYNDKQKRSDRKIKDYYNHIKSSKKTALQQEMIVQVGERDDFSDKANIELANEVLKEWFDGFQARNPNLKVYNAVIHNDEASPHMHLNFVPVASGYKRGLEKQVAFDRAITQQDPTLDKEYPFEDWREKEVGLLEKMLQERGIERKHVGKNEYRDVNEFKAKQREMEQLQEMDKELKAKLAHIEDTKVKMSEMEQIDKRKFIKGGLGSLVGLSEKRVEVSKGDYETLIRAGRQNVKLRKQNYELAMKIKAVTEREKTLDGREQELELRENEYRQKASELEQRGLALNEKEKQVDALYERQKDVNGLLERAEQANEDFKQENRALKATASDLRGVIENMKVKLGDYQKRLRGAYESLTNVVKAFGMFKYDNGDYKADLTPKQKNLVDAVSKYGELWTEKEGFPDLAEDMKNKIGISKGIESQLPVERQISRERRASHDDMSL